MDVFDTGGTLVKHFAVHGPLHSPWGIAQAPSDIGPMSNAILTLLSSALSLLVFVRFEPLDRCETFDCGCFAVERTKTFSIFREDDVLRANFADVFNERLIAHRGCAVGNSKLADCPVGRGLIVDPRL